MDSLFLALFLAISFPSISLFPALAIPASSRTHNPAHLVHISFIPSSCFLLPSDSVSNPQLRLRSCSTFLQFFGYFERCEPVFRFAATDALICLCLFFSFSLLLLFLFLFVPSACPVSAKVSLELDLGSVSGHSCNNFNFNFNIYFLGPRSGPSLFKLFAMAI